MTKRISKLRLVRGDGANEVMNISVSQGLVSFLARQLAAGLLGALLYSFIISDGTRLFIYGVHWKHGVYTSVSVDNLRA